MTARSTGFSSAASARLRSAFRISAEISTGERALPPMRSFTMSVSPLPGSIS